MDSDQTEVDIKIDGPSENDIDADSGHRVMDGGVSGLAKNLRGIPYFYRQDVVRHKKSGSIGIVNDLAGDSDSDSSIDDYDDDEEEEEEGDGIEDEGGDGGHLNNGDKNANEKKGGERAKSENLEVGQVRVLWLDDTEEIQHANDIMLLDRGFLHGDYVASASDPTGQVGVVQDVNISVDLLAPDGSIVKGVLSRDLKRVREFVVGDYVVLGPWLGRVDDVLDNVTVLIDDGSSCKVVGADPLHLKPVSTHNLEEDGQFPYYPGQRVRASSSSVFKNSRWLSGFWKANRLEGTVTKVTVGSVFIYWIASAGYGPDSAAAPSEKQSPKNLKLLSCFAHANWQVGDWCLLTPVLRSSSIILEKNLYKLGLQNSTTSENQRKNGCESEETPQEQLDEVKEPMDVDQVASTNENGSQSNSRDPVQNSTTSETQQENGCESEDTPHEELGEVKEPMDIDQVASTSENGSQSNSRDPVHETWPLYRKKMRRVFIRKDKKARKKEENFEKSFMIINSSTKVDVAWQDGTVGHGMDSKLLVPIDSPGDHEFVAEQYVVEKASDDIVNISETRRCGVIQSVNAKERTACVRWLKPVERPEDPREFDTQEIVSVYELEGHPDYDYTYGDVVVRLSPVSVPTSAISNGDSDVESRQQIEDGDDPNTEEHNSSKIGDNPSGEASTLLDLSWVGNITDLKNGDIEVTWADGMVSTVGPQAIFVVGRDDDDDNDSIANGSEVSHGAASWETVEDDDDDEMDALENAQEEAGSAKSSYRDSEGGGSNSGRNSALSLPLAAIDFVTRLASGIFSRRKNVDESFSDSQGEGELQDQDTTYISDERDSSDDSISQKSIITDNYNAESTHGKGEESADDEAPATSNISEGSCNVETERADAALFSDDNNPHFKRFDTAKDPLDHYFIGSSGQINSGRKWLKKVQQDWSILQNNLPDDIYVRVYEDRMDLIRAAIVGPYGTPYQDGLFFFDFFLPPEYPDVPPTAHYHSGGWRINPNLYEEGKVCLSLLNTWSGRGNEVWDPKSSSILQVLVSLQGLVLNSRPYFNEAGYDKQAGTAEGEKNSLSYNENTFLLNCKTMMYLMRRPPKDFEELIGYHFKRRGWYILKACDAYMKGSLIGSLSRDAASAGMEEKSNMTSVGFKLMLAKILPKLYSALSDVGCDCAEFKHLVPGDNKIGGDCFCSSLTLSQI